MGKYMKKSKIASDVAVMEVSLAPQCSLGVRTRAKTLALRRQQQESQKSPPLVGESSFSYLELRSRRLEKPPLLSDAHRISPRSGELCAGNPSPKIVWSNSRFRAASMESVDSVANEAVALEDGNDVAFEASFGESNLEFEGKDRNTRESTPCSSFIREPDTVTAPGSTTRRRNHTGANQRVNDVQRSIPTAYEMDEFFASAEQEQQRIFIEKYNFDIVSDSPLPGRYEWVQVMP